MARASSEPKLVVALSSFLSDSPVREGEIYAADDPLVRKHPKLFGPIQVKRSEQAVEQATAAPGEKRGA